MRDHKWIWDVKPDEARAALAALDARKGEAMTVREVLELRKLRLALQAKVDGQ
jgi:hypothetical protein